MTAARHAAASGVHFQSHHRIHMLLESLLEEPC
jgi:hypothetical protein